MSGLKGTEEEKLKEWQGQCPWPWFPGSGGCACSSSGHSGYSRDRAHNSAPTLPPTTVLAKQKKKKESSNINASDFNSLSQLQRCYTTREPSSRNWSDVGYSHLPGTAAPAAIGKWEAAAVALVTEALPTLPHLLYPRPQQSCPRQPQTQHWHTASLWLWQWWYLDYGKPHKHGGTGSSKAPVTLEAQAAIKKSSVTPLAEVVEGIKCWLSNITSHLR